MVELDQYKYNLSNLRTSLNELGDSLEVASKEEKVVQLEKAMEEQHFWDDAEHSAKVIKEVKGLKNTIDNYKKLQTLYDVGLGYIKIGQPSTTLSGGEAQRVKLATELSRKSTGKTVYILDEPTTGLHIADVHKLTDVLSTLVEGGNTVIVIEHNLDVIKVVDHIIDLGPEGGDKGGKIVFEGTPEEITKCKKSYTGKYLSKYLK